MRPIGREKASLVLVRVISQGNRVETLSPRRDRVDPTPSSPLIHTTIYH